MKKVCLQNKQILVSVVVVVVVVAAAAASGSPNQSLSKKVQRLVT
jgi:hypothetical protein